MARVTELFALSVRLSTGECSLRPRIFYFKSVYVPLYRSFYHELIYRDSLQTYKDLKVHKAVDCGNETFPVKVTGFRADSVNQSLSFSGQINVLEERLPSNMEFEISMTRCNLDKTGCVFFDRIIFPKLCEKMETRTSVAYQIVSGIKPALTCPIKRGQYELEHCSKASRRMIQLLPEGSLWRGRVVFFEKKGVKRFRPIACAEYELSIASKTHRPK